MNKGCVLALTGKASDAIRMITSGIGSFRSTRSNNLDATTSNYLANAYAELGQIDDARRCIGEAMTALQTTKERWFEAEVNRIAGEIALKSPKPDAAKAQAHFERALAVARSTASQILGTPRRHEPRAALARPGQGAASARTARSGLRVVH